MPSYVRPGIRKCAKNRALSVWLAIAMVGAIMFLLIFESGHSRYLIQFLPIMLFMSGIGLSSISYVRK